MKLTRLLQMTLTLTMLSFGSHLVAQSNLFDIVNGLRDEQPNVVISIPPAVEHLNLNGLQEKVVKDLIQEQNAELREHFSSRSVGTTDKEFRKKYFEIHRKFEQRFTDLLLPDQEFVFDQYRAVEVLKTRLDSKLPGEAAILFFEPIVNALSLSKKQKEKLKELSKSFESDVATAKEDSASKRAELAKKCQRELRLQLTPKQVAIFEAKLGETFQYDSDFFKDLFATTGSFPRPRQKGVSVSLETKQPTIGHMLWPASSLDAPSSKLVGIRMLDESIIADEVNLNADQEKTVREIVSRLETALDGKLVTVKFPAYSDVKNPPKWETEDGEDALSELSVFVRKFDVSLTKRQSQRLDQLIVQLLIQIRSCNYPLQHPDWIRVLEFTVEQKSAFETKENEFLTAVQDDLKSMKGDIVISYQKFTDESQKVLTDRQREILRELLGEFSLSPK